MLKAKNDWFIEPDYKYPNGGYLNSEFESKLLFEKSKNPEYYTVSKLNLNTLTFKDFTTNI